MPLHVSRTMCSSSRGQNYIVLSQPAHGTATYKCDDTRGCIIQFNLLMINTFCSNHVEAWSKLILKQKFCTSSWLITKINLKSNYISSCLAQTKVSRNIIQEWPVSTSLIFIPRSISKEWKSIIALWMGLSSLRNHKYISSDASYNVRL